MLMVLFHNESSCKISSIYLGVVSTWQGLGGTIWTEVTLWTVGDVGLLVDGAHWTIVTCGDKIESELIS